jgi:hypothetical protein
LILSAILYFATGFTVLNLWLTAQLKGLRHSEDEVGKSRTVLKGLVAHFVISLLILVVYRQLLYQGRTIEVITALSVYCISFVAYIAGAMKVK